jgi:hypothetical protein
MTQGLGGSLHIPADLRNHPVRKREKSKVQKPKEGWREEREKVPGVERQMDSKMPTKAQRKIEIERDSNMGKDRDRNTKIQKGIDR